MLDPQVAIIKSFYKALTTPALTLNYEPFKVYTHAPVGAKQYVLLSQPTVTLKSATGYCREFECTLLVSIYTCFNQDGVVSDLPALEIAEQVTSRLLLERLEMESGFTMDPIDLQLANTLHDSDDQHVYVMRYLRVRFTVNN